jgi:hypothetical protein
MSRWALCVAFGLLLAGPAQAQEDELVRLRRAIAERRERVASFEREERGLFDAIRRRSAARNRGRGGARSATQLARRRRRPLRRFRGRGCTARTAR